MKRQFFVLLGLLVTPAIAEVSPFLYNEEYALEYSDVDAVDNVADESSAAKMPVKVSRQPTATSSRNTASRGTASRAAPTTTANASGRATSGAEGRVVSVRGGESTSSRSASDSARSVSERTTTASRTAVSPRTTSARTATTNTTRTATTANATRSASAAGRATAARSTTARAATTSTGAQTSRVGVVNTVGTINAGDSLYNRNNSRYSVSSSNVTGTSSKIGSRVPAIRIASTTTSVTENATSTADALKQMDDLAEMTDYCKAQYAACMDNYCNVLDDNQGRCSCSANLKNYAKAETALKTATEELQDVAQKIQYIGLSTREVETLFSETEAELTMSSTTDNSQIKTSLDKIKNMLVEVRTGTASSDVATTSNFGFDMNGLLDFTIDSTGFDLSSLFGGFGGTTNSVNNLRGEELYKSAVNRCKTAVLKSCTNQGVDANLVTNSYDLQIDKECVLYERSLTDSNDQMVATIRNAKNVLQKARLLVSQQKNVYDMRGCINALDSCMQDEFVCGTDYENCLDPTGRYIVNGEIVLGSQPGHAIDPKTVYSDSDNTNSANATMTNDVCAVNLYRTWDMPGETCGGNNDGKGNAWNANETLMNYIENTVKTGAAKKISTNMSEYLQNKIGYYEGDKNYGMCMSVLNKCQDYTYTGTGSTRKYNPENDVIKQYLSRILVQIKSKQDQVLSDYADSCISDVTSCLSQNNYPSTASSVKNSTVANIAINACRPTIITCMSVNGYLMGSPTPTELAQWVCGVQFPNDYNVCKGIQGSSGTRYNIAWYVGNTPVSGCAMTDYESGTAQTIPGCASNIVNPYLPQYAVFNGEWCLDSELNNCTSSITTSQSTTGNKVYFAKWDCEDGYMKSDNSCVPEPTCSAAYPQYCNSTTCSNLSASGFHWCSTTDGGNPTCTTDECYVVQPNFITVTLNDGNSVTSHSNPQTIYCQTKSDVTGCERACYKNNTYANNMCSNKVTYITIPERAGYTYKGHKYNSQTYINNGGMLDVSKLLSLPSTATINADWSENTSTQTPDYQKVTFVVTNE